MANDETLWERDDHTLGKHQVLRYYLDGWFPILGRYNQKLLFIDGFAGPGEYAGGEPGSPIIALDCIKQHKEKGSLHGDVVSIFIEGRQDRAEHLKNVVRNQPKVEGVARHVLQGTFGDHIGELLDYIDSQNKILAPAFVMIDPFGVKGNPIDLVRRILGNPKSEVFVSFMYEPIRRFHRQPEFEPHLTSLFGSDAWKQCLRMEENEEKKRFLHDLFKQQLKNCGAEHVVNFELWKGNIHKYSIYFATGHEKGCDLMKSAIWRAVPDGSYGFRGHNQNQMVMVLDSKIDTGPLAAQLKEQFGDQPTPIEQIDTFVMSDKTIYHKGQLRRATLVPLEKENLITVNRPHGGRGFTPKKGITVRFH